MASSFQPQSKVGLLTVVTRATHPGWAGQACPCLATRTRQRCCMELCSSSFTSEIAVAPLVILNQGLGCREDFSWTVVKP